MRDSRRTESFASSLRVARTDEYEANTFSPTTRRKKALHDLNLERVHLAPFVFKC
jgi:hypothetical protein